MDRDLSRSLHALTFRLDRAADRILRAERNVSYRRFLTLYAIGVLGAPSQRAVAEWMGVSEPSVSRMTRVLVDEGFLDAPPDPAGGNRRRLELTASGQALVASCGGLLEDRFAALVETAGVSYGDYRESTQRLFAALTQSADAPSHRAVDAGARLTS
jgi:DNA-binding MarR family transcriptional regulator